jgi:sugar lactone lactonase YvrE
VSRIEKDGKRTILVDKYDGKRLNSPNDVIFHSNGDMYFTDPPYGLERIGKIPHGNSITAVFIDLAKKARSRS